MFYQNQCEQLKQNTKKLWDLINKTTGRINDKICIVKFIKNGDIYHHTASSISNEFAKYFSEVGNKYSDKIKSPAKNIGEYNRSIPISKHTLFLNPTNEQEVIRLITALPNKKSSGFDKVDNTVLKELKYELAMSLTSLFNRSLSEGIFPDKMKIVEVIPLYKNKERYYTTNYRPISLLLTISKILEKILYVRTYNFLNNSDQIFRSQYGF